MSLQINPPENPDNADPNFNINDVLSEDALAIIFEKLPLRNVFPLRRVCRYWFQIINDYILKTKKELTICFFLYSTNKYFKKKDISECYYVRSWKQLVPLVVYHQQLRALKVFNFQLDRWFLNDFIIHLKNLRSISLVECQFTFSPSQLIELLPDITKLELIDIGLDDDDLLQFTNLPKLEHLNVSRNLVVNGEFIETLPSSLKVLQMRHCCSIWLNELQSNLKMLADKNCKLEVLDLKHIEYTEKNTVVFYTPDPLVPRLDWLKHLKVLKVSTSSLFDHTECSSESFPNIEKLVFYEYCNPKYPPLLSETFIDTFFHKKFFNLKFLNLTSSSLRMTDYSFAKCLKACPYLTTLKIRNLQLTPQSLIMIKNLRWLEYLKLADIFDLNNDTIMEIIVNCIWLKRLWIDFDQLNRFPSYGFNERFIFCCIEFFDKNPDRKLELQICKSVLPPHQVFTTIPKNLKLSILKSRISNPVIDIF